MIAVANPSRTRTRQIGLASNRRGVVRAVLCDADGNLFPSEEPAFLASAEVTNEFLAAHGVDRSYSAEELRVTTTGLNFRSTAVALALANGVPVAPELCPAGEARPSKATRAGPILTAQVLEEWVLREKRTVTTYLRTVLKPDADVLVPLTGLAAEFELAVVSSSAESRINACLDVTGLAGLFPATKRFSAEDSLPQPRSKPHPDIYRHTGRALALGVDEAVAVEDSVPGVTSAVAAGFSVIGNVQFVSPTERESRCAALQLAGADWVVDSWRGVIEMLSEV